MNSIVQDVFGFAPLKSEHLVIVTLRVTFSSHFQYTLRSRSLHH